MTVYRPDPFPALCGGTRPIVHFPPPFASTISSEFWACRAGRAFARLPVQVRLQSAGLNRQPLPAAENRMCTTLLASLVKERLP